MQGVNMGDWPLSKFREWERVYIAQQLITVPVGGLDNIRD